MLKQFSIVVLLGIIQSVYDFIGWYFILNENPKKEWHRYVFRTFKEVSDSLVTIYICRLIGIDWSTLAAFYTWKWFHLCDSLYNLYWKVITKRELPWEGYWRWWTPLGMYRTIIESWKSKSFVKGIVNLEETLWMTGIGMIVSVMILMLN